MVRATTLAVLATLSVLLSGCSGDGLSDEDATARCDQERDSKGAFVTDESYDECIACYTECGDNCAPQATAPATYTCPAE